MSNKPLYFPKKIDIEFDKSTNCHFLIGSQKVAHLVQYVGVFYFNDNERYLVLITGPEKHINYQNEFLCKKIASIKNGESDYETVIQELSEKFSSLYLQIKKYESKEGIFKVVDDYEAFSEVIQWKYWQLI